jgi:hypothetical protein
MKTQQRLVRAAGAAVLAASLALGGLLMFMPPPTHVAAVITGLVILASCGGVLLTHGMQRWIGAAVSVLFAIVLGAGALAARNASTDGVQLPLTLEAHDARCALEISGDLTDDLYRRLRTTLDEHPSIRGVVLRSAGGSALSITRVANLLRERQVNIAVMRDQCDSACAFLWVAAPQRLIAGNIAAGFHAPHVSLPWTGPYRAVIQEAQQRRYLLDAGLPPDFIGWAYAPLDAFWKPDAAQLARMGVQARYIKPQRADNLNFCDGAPRMRET